MRSLVGIVLSTLLLLGCSPAVESGRAAQIAQEYVVAAQASDSVVHDVTVGEPQWRTNHWRVQVDAIVTNRQPNGDPVEVPVHYLIDVDGTTGAASIAAQG